MNFDALRVLVVDDMEMMRKVTSDQLRSLGISHIEHANDGLAALKALRQRQFDVVLADWNMPVMSGIELLKRVRSDAMLYALPLIMVTAESERSRVQEAIAHGVSELMVKPYTAQRLRDKLCQVMQRAGVRLAAAKAAAAKAQAEEQAAAAGAPIGLDPAPAGAAAPGLAAPAGPAHDGTRLTLLAVDDTPDNLRVVSRIFEDRFRVRLAHTGEKALAICASDDPPDLMLLDVMMPNMDGFEVARRLRAMPDGDQIPVIFVTAMDDVAAQRRGLSLGAVDFISKPIDPDILTLRVQNLARMVLRHKERQEEYDAMLATARQQEDVDRMLRHDLRGPLAGVLALARQLAATPGLGAEPAELARLIEQGSTLALDTIGLAASLFKIEAGRYVPSTQPVALDGVLQQVAALARASFASKEISVLLDLAAPPGACASGDAALYHAVFHNLLKNAGEAAPEGSQVNLVLSGTAELTVTVSNRGAVAAEMREHLFTKYASTKPDGTGLGLYSARLLIEAHGGRITLHSDERQDLTMVTVTLPRRAEAHGGKRDDMNSREG